MTKIVKQPHGGEIHLLEKGETANPDGRPKTALRLLLDEWESQGRGKVSKADIDLAYLTALEMDEEEMKRAANDKTAPMLVRIACRQLLKDRGFDIMERMIDRTHGKSSQPLTGADGKSPIQIEQTVSDEVFGKLMDRYAANQSTEAGSVEDKNLPQ